MFASAIVDFVFPPRCGACRRPGSWLCAGCLAAARPAPLWRCESCGRATSVDPCPMCAQPEAGLDSLVASVLLEGPIREAVHRMKYGDRPQLADSLAALFGAPPHDEADAVLVPVPLEPRRRRRRGYNQAERLARALGRGTRLEVIEGLHRARNSGSQVGRSGSERRQALVGAFEWRGGGVPAVVVLVDDVVTTGATLVECGMACRAAGVSSVYGVALAAG